MNITQILSPTLCVGELVLAASKWPEADGVVCPEIAGVECP